MGRLENIPDWLNKALLNGVVRVHSTKEGYVDYLEIEIAEYTIKAYSGDYIVKEIISEKIYPCREKIFEETYDSTES